MLPSAPYPENTADEVDILESRDNAEAYLNDKEHEPLICMETRESGILCGKDRNENKQSEISENAHRLVALNVLLIVSRCCVGRVQDRLKAVFLFLFFFFVFDGSAAL